MQNNDDNPLKRYSSAAIVFGTAAVIGGSALYSSHASNAGSGLPFSYGGRQYYVREDSRRIKYPTKEDCMKDVPAAKQNECEPVSTYYGGRSGWYGPLYSPKNPSDTYQPSGKYPSEPASSANFGKKFPSSASSGGFGSNGKAFTGSGGS